MMERIRTPDGGFSYDAVQKKMPTTGYLLSIYPERSVGKKADEISPNDFIDYAINNADLILDAPGNFLGGWHDPDSGLVFFDVSVHVDDEGEADKLCREKDQKAYFDVANRRVVTVNREATSGGADKRKFHGIVQTKTIAFESSDDDVEGRARDFQGRDRKGSVSERNRSRGSVVGKMGTKAGGGFTGKETDSIGRTICFREGVHVPCGEQSGADGKPSGQTGEDGVRDGRGMGGGGGGVESSRAAVAEYDTPLIGLPTKVKIKGVEFSAGPDPRVRKAAFDYMKAKGLSYHPPTKYVKVDADRAKRIAAEFEKMRHAPNDTEVKEAYAKMSEEVIGQYQAALQAGLKVEFIDFSKQGDPYAASPRLAIEDIKRNNHMWVFPTSSGFGSDASVDVSQNPLLAETEFEISGKKACVNDLFRVVHDYFGHAKEGNGMRADGEENAWRSHAAMFTPLARKAMTSETRGQNSWVNFGPHAEHNKKASGADTIYSDQKVGLLPDWCITEGAADEDEERGIKSPSFKKWFGDWEHDPNHASQVTDAEGKPLRVYHGTKINIEEFAPEREGTNSNVFGSWKTKRSGIFFAEDPAFAEEFATQGGDSNGANTVPVYLNVRQPVDLTNGFPDDVLEELKSAGMNSNYYLKFKPSEVWEVFDHENDGKELVAALKKLGYDGARISDVSEGENTNTATWVAFDSNQIKSAIGNSGAYDPAESHIGKALTKTHSPHKFGCVTVPVADPLRKQIIDWVLENIPDFHLSPEGRELKPHVTLKYGFRDQSEENVQALRALFTRHGPIEVRLTKVGLFTGGKDGDVLHLEVDSPQMHTLNAQITAEFDCEDKHPTYIPHLSLAYLLPEISATYVDMATPFDGAIFTADAVEWSDADKNRETIPLTFLPPLAVGLPGEVKGSYLSECPRDAGGHCLPRDSADETGSPDNEAKEDSAGEYSEAKNKLSTVEQENAMDQKEIEILQRQYDAALNGARKIEAEWKGEDAATRERYNAFYAEMSKAQNGKEAIQKRQKDRRLGALKELFGTREERSNAAMDLDPKLDYNAWVDKYGDEKVTAEFHKARAVQREWEKSIRHAVTFGILTAEEATELGSGIRTTGYKYEPVTGDLYHVTTAADAILKEGFKTREELHQDSGKGLGGGDDTTVSFTDDLEAARGIMKGMREAHQVARGEIDGRDLLREAVEGGFIEDVLRQAHSEWAGKFDPAWLDDDEAVMKNLPNGVADALLGIDTESGMGTPPSKPGDWKPHPKAYVWEGGDGQKKYGLWYRTLDPDEAQWRRFSLYKSFSYWRQVRTGVLDPLFFGSDLAAFAKIDPGQIKLLKAKPKPGIYGYRISAEKEWRIHTGDAVKVVGVVDDEPLGKSIPIPMAIKRLNVQTKDTKAMSWLDSSTGGALVKPPEQKNPLPVQCNRPSLVKMINQKMFAPFLARRIKGSYFGECERDEGGHCLPSGESSNEAPKEAPKPEKPVFESADDLRVYHLNRYDEAAMKLTDDLQGGFQSILDEAEDQDSAEEKTEQLAEAIKAKFQETAIDAADDFWDQLSGAHGTVFEGHQHSVEKLAEEHSEYFNAAVDSYRKTVLEAIQDKLAAEEDEDFEYDEEYYAKQIELSADDVVTVANELLKEYEERFPEMIADYEEDAEDGGRKWTPIPPSVKSLRYFTKDRGQPCKQGETAASDGCIPASGDSGGGKPYITQEQVSGPKPYTTNPKPVKKPAKRSKMVSAKRVGEGKDAHVVLSNGQPAPSHITAKLFAPSWRGVKVALDPEADVLATGTYKNKRGETVTGTVYNPKYLANNQAANFAKILEGLKKRDAMIAQVKAARKDPATAEAADAVWLMMTQGTRPGSDSDTKHLEHLYGQPVTAASVIVANKKVGKKVRVNVALKIGDESIPIRDQGVKDELLKLKKEGEDLQDSTYWLKSFGATTLEGRHVIERPDGVHLRVRRQRNQVARPHSS